MPRLVSAFPDLHRHTVLLCLATLVLITLVNLRGTGNRLGMGIRAPDLPLHRFVLGGAGRRERAGRSWGHGHPKPVVAPPGVAGGEPRRAVGSLAPAAGIREWLPRPLTGVEAVSNGITAFREPAVVNARRTLTVIVATLAALLGGIAYLCAGSMASAAMDQGRPGLSKRPFATGRRSVPDAASLPHHNHQPAGCSLLLSWPTPASSTSPPLPAGRDRRLSPSPSRLVRPPAGPARSESCSWPVRQAALFDRLWRNHRASDPALCRGCVPRLHALAGGHGLALAPGS